MAKRTTRRGKAAGNKVEINFEGVETRVLLPEGIYDTEVAEVKMEEKDSKPYLAWTFTTIDDDEKFNGKKLYNNTSLQPQALWVLAGMLDSMGVERPDGPMDLDLTELVGLPITLQVEHEEYNGKTRSKVVDYMMTAEDSGEDEVESVNDENEEEEEGEAESYTEEEINEMDADELADVIEETGIKVRKVKKLDTMRAKVIAALEEAGLIGEEEGEEGESEEESEEGEELYSEDEVMEMSSKELDELVKEEELEVDKPKRATKGAGLKKYREAVVEALEEAELLEDEEE